MKKFLVLKAQHRILPSVLFAFLVLWSGSLSFGQDLKSRVDNLKAFIKEKLPNVDVQNQKIKAYLNFMDVLVGKKRDINVLKATISPLGLIDNARNSSMSASFDTNITKDLYPNALRFKTSTKFSFSNNSVQNEITSILFNYDYYLSDTLELYGFMERFTDSFMSIKQRYELGSGVKFEYGLDPIASFVKNPNKSISGEDKRVEEKVLVKFLAGYGRLRGEFLEFIWACVEEPDLRDQILALIEPFERDVKLIKIAYKKKRSVLTVGIAFSLFSEVEQAELNTGAKDPTTSKDIIVLLDPAQMLRLTIRPSIAWKISDSAELSSALYWKLPLARGVNLFGQDDRVDFQTKFDLQVAKDFIWGGPASLSLEYQYHFDRNPPALSADQRLKYRDMALLYFHAGKSHGYYALKFNISF